MHDHWIADRMKHLEVSGIRKVFELARSLKNPINLSIGLPDFDVPESVRAAAHAAIDAGTHAYTVTQGIPELRDKIQSSVRERLGHRDREVFLTSGTSGGLMLAFMTAINPGDEVVVFDPYFVMYPQLVRLLGGVPVFVDTYPDFRLDVDKVRSALTPRTKLIVLNSPSNPTGAVYSRESIRDLAQLAKERDILLFSDEVYRAFTYDQPFVSPAEFNDQVIVFDGFSKAYSMTGWRLGFAHGPKRFMDEMIKLQQFSYVCAPSLVQHAGVAAWDYDLSKIVTGYRQKRDMVCEGLSSRFELTKPGGAFYLFIPVRQGSATDFVSRAIQNNLILIPGQVFSKRDTHFRLSYAAADETLDAGIRILNRLAG